MRISIDDEIKAARDDGYREGRLGGRLHPYGYTHDVLRHAWREGYEEGVKDRKDAEKEQVAAASSIKCGCGMDCHANYCPNCGKPITRPVPTGLEQAPARVFVADDLASKIAMLLRLRPGLELLIYDNDGENFGVRLFDTNADGPAKCIRRAISFDIPFVLDQFITAEQAAEAAKANGGEA